tara:strand:+ start:201 stop:899 length:699 start_codon:yes stop_codon:yes gene_type:complete
MRYNFKRYEKKFLINSNQERKLKEIFNKTFFKDSSIKSNKGYYCLSIYFDDTDMSLMNAKVEGLKDRFKIRLRAYLNQVNDDIKYWNLEIKNKKNSSVIKKKKRIENKDFERIMKSQNYNLLFKNIFETTFKFYKPTYVTFYFREAFESKIFDHCRITIDNNILCEKYFPNVLKKISQKRNYILDPRQKLLEVKYSSFLPNSISEILRSLNLDQITFSKYVDGAIAVQNNNF